MRLLAKGGVFSGWPEDEGLITYSTETTGEAQNTH
jgi:hypothetical protein